MTYSPSQGGFVGGQVPIDPIGLQEAQQEVDQLTVLEDQRKKDEQERLKAEQEQKAAEVEAAKPKNNVAQEVGTATVGGLVDFAEGIGTTFNVPWLEMDDKVEPMNQTQWGKALRSAVELIVPTVALGAVSKVGMVAGLTKLVGAQKLAGVSKPVAFLGNAGIDAAAGLAVDSVSQQSMEHNLAGVLKPMFPWIPDNIATLDTDSPEIMREKNMKEGVGLGFGVDLLTSGVMFVRGLRGLPASTKVIPQDQAAREYNQSITLKSPSIVPTEEVAKDITDAKTRLSQYETERANLEEAIFNGSIEDPTIVQTRLAELETGINKESDILNKLTKKVGSPKTPADIITEAAEQREQVLVNHAVHQVDYYDPEGIDAHFAVNAPLYDVNEKAVISADLDAVRKSDIAAARIKYNIDTTDGSLPPLYDSATIKRVLDTEDPLKRSLVVNIRDTRAKAGTYSAKTGVGKDITAAQIKAASDDDLRALVGPGISEDLIPALKEYFSEGRLQTAWQGGGTYADLTKSSTGAKMARFIRDNFGIESLKASGRLQTTLARQVADIATAAKTLGDSVDITRQQEIMIDALQVISRENAVSSYALGRGLQLWDLAVKKAANLKNGGDVLKNATSEAETGLRESINKADEAVTTIRELNKTNPEMAKALLYAYEATGGKVSTVNSLNKWYQSSTSVLKKAIVNNEPEVPSVIQQGIWSTIYNSVLSGTVTPLRAWAGNTVGTLLKPTTALIGSAIRGDSETFKRTMVQYGALKETTSNAWDHFGLVLKRLRDDPDSVAYFTRDDIVTQNDQAMQALHQFAKAKELEGEGGPMVMYQTARMMRDFNNHPLVRYSANAMGAGDGFTRAFMANVEARGRAYDELVRSGLPITAENVQAAQKKLYAQMFDSDGLIKDDVVDYVSREIAMNLDSPTATGLSTLLTRYPVMKPFMLFPRTSLNILSFAQKHSPLARWWGESSNILRAAKEGDPDQIKQIMQSRGYSNFSEAEWNTLVAETRGRIAIGDLTVSGAAGLYLSGNLTGNGPQDRKKRDSMVKNGWTPRSIKLMDKWVSYESIEPFATFLALIADIGDMSTDIGTTTTEKLFKKVAYAFSMNVTNKSFLAGITPMTDILSGNEAGAQRFVANMGNNLLPYSSLRNQLSQLMLPGLREVENDIGQLMRNRNTFIMDAIDPDGALPYQIDYMDGSKIRDHDFLTRILNAAQPFKLNPTAEPYRQWLIDTGFDTLPILNVDRWSGEFTGRQKSELAAIMGQNGQIKKQVEALMKRPDIVKDMKWIESQRAAGISSEKLDISKSKTHIALRDIFTTEKRKAEAILYSRYPELRTRGNLKSVQEKQQSQGNYAAVNDIIQLRNGK
jgi:hypothetical protein